MPTARLTAKGQITLPKQIRDALGLNAGDRIKFVVTAEGRCTLVPIKSPIVNLKGCVPAPNKTVSVDAMDRAIRQRAAKQSKSKS